MVHWLFISGEEYEDDNSPPPGKILISLKCRLLELENVVPQPAQPTFISGAFEIKILQYLDILSNEKFASALEGAATLIDTELTNVQGPRLVGALYNSKAGETV